MSSAFRNPGAAAAPPPLDASRLDPPADPGIDYCARALMLWPRLERNRLVRARHDPARVAALVSQRTTLPLGAILELLGVPATERHGTARGN